ncbi:MAG: serine hydrolase [Ignavibacteriales bacterium]|nr:serine hydrolase [Ignavibacteriales bacterium]
MEKRIDSLFAAFNRPDGPGASVMVIRNGRTLLAKGYGMAYVEARRSATPSTNYRLASVTKQFTATAVTILADRKKLRYDNVLTDFFPDFPAYGKKITVKNLLQHTSGLIDYESVMPDTTTVQLLDKDVLSLMKKQDSTYFEPGTRYLYSNSGYALLALIVEKRSGMTFAKFLQKSIFRPLKMNNTVAYENGISAVKNRAYGYSPVDSLHPDLFRQTDQSMTSAVLGDGGIYSSVMDLAKWDKALYNSPLVRKKTQQIAFVPNILPDGTNSEYGFGWRISDYKGVKRIHHSGSTIGFRNEIQRFPDKRTTIIVLTNRDNANPKAMVERIAEMLLFAQ